MDNPFITQTAGQADWDSGLNANFQSLERGYHVTERAGTAIQSGMVMWLNSGGFFFPFDPNSATIFASAFAFSAAASGDSMTALAWGIVRSLGINSPAIPGKLLYTSALTPGLIVTSYAGADRPVGMGLSNYGVLFNPSRIKLPQVYSPSYITASLVVTGTNTAAVTNFTMVASGLFGWNRRVRINGTPTNAEVKFYEDSGRTRLMYSTISGGISAANSFHDRAGFPFDTDSGTIYGTAKNFDSNADVTVIADWEV